MTYDSLGGFFKVFIYTFNQTSLQFDNLGAFYSTTEAVRYASLSEDKTYLGISTS